MTDPTPASGSGPRDDARPVVALTLGDVAGIGPELIARVVADDSLRQICRPVVVGHPAVLDRALQLVGADLSCRSVSSATEAAAMDDTVCCWNPGRDDAAEVPPGGIDPRAGRAAYDYLVGAIDETRTGTFDAIVTAPLNKAALHAGGVEYPGHTEILAERCGVSDFAMMLYLPPGEAVHGPYGLGVAHVTLHTSIRSVPDLLTTPAVAGKIALVDGFLRRLDCPRPRVGVCALNPHGGEQGLFGDEEERIILPAVRAAVAQGIQADGPIPADALMRRAAAGEFDGVVAMYHDQGHIALKLLGFERAVNVTLGLPIVRTSPSHGTAFDIAWQGAARADGMRAAIQLAVQLAAHRDAPTS